MDVHPPHTPIHGLRDFLIHLLTITAGLLIALGLEAAVERVHHQHQLTEARESIHAEIARNKCQLEDLQPRLAQQQQIFQQMLDSIGDLRAHRVLTGSPKMFLSGASLSRASWDTAQSSGALALMPYGEASRLADIYQVQGIFDQLQVQTLNAYGPLLGYLPVSGSLEAASAFTPGALDSLEDKLKNSRGQCRILIGAAGELKKTYQSLDEAP